MTPSERPGSIEFGPGDRVAIVAGGGQLPVAVAEALSAGGMKPFVVCVTGEASDALRAYEHADLTVENFAGLAPLLQRAGVTHAVFGGEITRRPRLSGIRPSFALLKILSRAIVALRKGDDGLLRALAETVESYGVKVVGAHQVAPDLLASAGQMSATAPRGADWRDIEAGAEAARAIGALDIGQAAVAIGGRAIALEDVEGTDGLLQRARILRSHGRLAGKRRGVLVKCSKPGQELRVDLPTIGPNTVIGAHSAGLAGIAVEAGHTLVLDFANVVAEADRLGLFVVGLPPGGRT